jgi:hypothetical protein
MAHGGKRVGQPSNLCTTFLVLFQISDDKCESRSLPLLPLSNLGQRHICDSLGNRDKGTVADAVNRLHEIVTLLGRNQQHNNTNNRIERTTTKEGEMQAQLREERTCCVVKYNRSDVASSRFISKGWLPTNNVLLPSDHSTMRALLSR